GRVSGTDSASTISGCDAIPTLPERSPVATTVMADLVSARCRFRHAHSLNDDTERMLKSLRGSKRWVDAQIATPSDRAGPGVPPARREPRHWSHPPGLAGSRSSGGAGWWMWDRLRTGRWYMPSPGLQW